MLLRILTTFFLVFGIILTLSFPWVISIKPPQGAPKVDLQRYSILFGTYLTVDMLAFVGAAICAILLVRQVRNAYRTESRQNLEELVESALRQHKKSETIDES
jgi:hypothetical protein